MPRAIYLTHPEVVVDPKTPVPEWGLSGVGRKRLLSSAGKFTTVTRIIISTEQKARDGGEILGKALGIAPEALPDFGENDRSATGYLPEAEFWPVVRAFFAKPDKSTLGWETARHAQDRIVGAVNAALQSASEESITLFVGHGGVGSLLYAHLADSPIGTPDAMSNGMGRLFRFKLGKPPGPWMSLEDL